MQACDALAFCHHDLKLLHRDIKPANMLLTKALDLKIGMRSQPQHSQITWIQPQIMHPHNHVT